MWICSLCRLPVAKNHTFGQILTFGGSGTDPPFTVRVKFGVLEQTHGLHLHAKFHLNMFTVSAFDGQKTHFSANFDFWWAPVPTPFHRWGPNVVCYCRPTVYAYVQISSPSVYYVALCWRKLPNFCCFFRLRHLVVSPIVSSLRKVNTGAQLQHQSGQGLWNNFA